jgi:hypothetical protein
MASDNRISAQLTPAQRTTMIDAVAALKAVLAEVTINLTPEEKQSLPRMGDASVAFDAKCQDYMATRPDLVPSFLDKTEMAKDRQLVADLLPCLRELAPLCEALADTIMQANSDTYLGDLAFYQSVRQAAKRGVSGADTIYQDLQERYPGRKKKPKTADPVA